MCAMDNIVSQCSEFGCVLIHTDRRFGVDIIVDRRLRQNMDLTFEAKQTANYDTLSERL
jgi:hypothetical protein